TLLLLLKTNMPPAPGLRYHVQTGVGGIDTKGRQIEAPFVVWDGTTDKTADEVATTQSEERAAPKLTKAKVFLREALAFGPKPVAEVEAEARDGDIALITLRRAREALGIRAVARKGVMPAVRDYHLPYTIEPNDPTEDEPDFG